MSESAPQSPPEDEGMLRVLKVVVWVLGILIVLGVIGLGIGVAWKANRAQSSAPVKTAPAAPLSGAEPFTQSLALKPGERVIDIAIDEGRVAVRVSGPKGEAIHLFDAGTGRPLGVIAVQAAE